MHSLNIGTVFQTDSRPFLLPETASRVTLASLGSVLQTQLKSSILPYKIFNSFLRHARRDMPYLRNLSGFLRSPYTLKMEYRTCTKSPLGDLGADFTNHFRKFYVPIKPLNEIGRV